MGPGSRPILKIGNLFQVFSTHLGLLGVSIKPPGTRLICRFPVPEDWDIVGAGEVAVSRDAEERRYSGGNTCVHNDKPSNTTATTANNNNNSTRRSQPVSSSSPAHLVASSIRSAFVGGNFLQSVSQHFEKTLNNLEKVMGKLMFYYDALLINRAERAQVHKSVRLPRGRPKFDLRSLHHPRRSGRATQLVNCPRDVQCINNAASSALSIPFSTPLYGPGFVFTWPCRLEEHGSVE